jgi:hypothetical protein
MDSIFKNKTEKEGASVINLEILVVLIIRLLRQDLSRIIKKIKLVKL